MVQKSFPSHDQAPASLSRPQRDYNGLMNKALIAPSILSADFACLGQEVVDVLKAGADIVHFDVMDNHYVPNLTIGPLVLEALRKHGIKAVMDVHLMVSPADRLIEDFVAAGADWISVHPDGTIHLDRTLTMIREAGCKAGVVLNPATPLSCLDHIMDRIDHILIMSVNPGFGGQSFIPEAIAKLAAARERIDAHCRATGHCIRLEIDGGVKPTNIGEIAAAGADTFVAGSAIFEAPDRAAAIGAMRSAIDANAVGNPCCDS